MDRYKNCTLYGAAANSELGRRFLHAHQTRFRRLSTGDAVEVMAPLAEELVEYSGQLNG